MKNWKRWIRCGLFGGAAAVSSANTDAGTQAWASLVAASTASPAALISTEFHSSEHFSVDLTGLSGASEATYEFIVNAPRGSQFTKFLLADSGWILKFDQEISAHSMLDELGVTEINRADRFFSKVNNASLAAPYERDVHIVFTSAADGTRAYVDGTQVGFLAGVGHIFASANARLGFDPRYSDALHGLDGIIYGFAAYGSALDERAVRSRATAAIAPRFTLLNPADGDQLKAGGHVRLFANDLLNGATPTSIEYTTETGIIGAATTFPYEFVWENIPFGTHTIRAVAKAGSANAAVSDPVTIDAISSANAVAIRPDGGVTITMTIEPGKVFLLRASNNLKTWTTVAVINGTGALQNISEAVDAASLGHRFYRIVPDI